MVVGGVGGEGSVDLVFGVQWSWVEPEEMPNEMKTLSDCVSRRLDQGNNSKSKAKQTMAPTSLLNCILHHMHHIQHWQETRMGMGDINYCSHSSCPQWSRWNGMGSGSLVIKHQRTKLLIRRWFSIAYVAYPMARTRESNKFY